MMCVHNASEIRKEWKVLQDAGELGDRKVGAGVNFELFYRVGCEAAEIRISFLRTSRPRDFSE
jgi:hypothetical protein